MVLLPYSLLGGVGIKQGGNIEYERYNMPRRLESLTLRLFNELFEEIDELNGDVAVKFCGMMWIRGLDILYDEVDRYYYVGRGSTSSSLDSVKVSVDNLYEWCAQFDNQDKAYEIIKFVREANPLESHIKRYGT